MTTREQALDSKELTPKEKKYIIAVLKERLSNIYYGAKAASGELDALKLMINKLGE